MSELVEAAGELRARIADLDLGSNGFLAKTINETLVAGVYYAALISSSATPSFLLGYPMFPASSSIQPPNSLHYGYLYETGSGTTLPATAAPTGWPSAAPPSIFLRVA